MASQFFLVSAIAAQGFWRCGRHFTKAGVVVDIAEFTDEQWERIKNEVKLRVKPATSDDTDAVDERTDQIADAIKSLTALDFQRDGKPKVDALNALLGDELGTKITTHERNTVWDILQDEGFEAPKPEE